MNIAQPSIGIYSTTLSALTLCHIQALSLAVTMPRQQRDYWLAIFWYRPMLMCDVPLRHSDILSIQQR
jgi:hypothetical protein